VDQLIGIYPARDRALDHELCRLLAYLESTEAVAPTVQLLSASRTSEDLLHYLWHLRHLHDGWTVAGLRAAFEALQRAEQHQGARDYLQALRDVRRDLTAFLSPETRAVLGNALAAGGARTPPPPVETSAYQFVKAWTIDDFSQADLAAARSLERGREAYAAAQCVQCHRIGEEAGGSIGPNLAGIGSRFGRRDLLRHILEPSLAIDDKFRNHNVTLKDGGVYVGAIESEDAREVRLAIGSGADAVITLPRADILRREASAVSPMPEGLLNNLTRTQILDLLTYLQAAAPPP
jgi:putative heme-binding domain-containing protein